MKIHNKRAEGRGSMGKPSQRWIKSALDGSSTTSPKCSLLPEGEGKDEGEPRDVTQRRELFAETFSPRPSTLDPRPLAAFTIIEIALCLGIIAFALVAIIGALPTGLNVQKQNRERTIIGQDASVWMDALRSGGMGYDDLTNYVVAVTNVWRMYKYNGNPGDPRLPLYGDGGGTAVGVGGVDWYTYNACGGGVSGFSMTNGAAIIGLLTTPTWTRPFNVRDVPGDYESNYVVAYVRSMSGPAVDKVPQSSATVLQDAFTYRMIVQNFPYAAVDTNGFCMNCMQTNALRADAQFLDRTNAAYSQWLLETNTHDFRLLFRWPVLPNGQIPNYGRYTFREMVDGPLMQSNYPNPPLFTPQFYVQPSIYVQITTNVNSTRPLPQ